MLHTGAGWKSRLRMIFPDIFDHTMGNKKEAEDSKGDKKNLKKHVKVQKDEYDKDGNKLILGIPENEFNIIKHPLRKFYYTTRKGNRNINYFAWWQTQEL